MAMISVSLAKARESRTVDWMAWMVSAQPIKAQIAKKTAQVTEAGGIAQTIAKTVRQLAIIENAKIWKY
jgi:hypothetical protein